MKLYGTTNSELESSQNQQCREIVKEILDFGINQKQLFKIIYLLSLELENISLLKQITDVMSQDQSVNEHKRLIT